jgi:hypothetical protein
VARHTEEVIRLSEKIDTELVRRGVGAVLVNSDKLGGPERHYRIAAMLKTVGVKAPFDKRVLKSIGLAETLIAETGGLKVDSRSGLLTDRERHVLEDSRNVIALRHFEDKVFTEGHEAGWDEPGGPEAPGQRPSPRPQPRPQGPGEGRAADPRTETAARTTADQSTAANPQQPDPSASAAFALPLSKLKKTEASSRETPSAVDVPDIDDRSAPDVNEARPGIDFL